MADFPVLVLRKIFDFLDPRERLIARCTCRLWKFVIETFNSPQSLCVNAKGYPFNVRWCFSNQIVAKDEIIHLKDGYDPNAIHKFILGIEFFRNLQRVYLYQIGDEATDLFLNEMHHLTRLKVLMIDVYAIKRRTLSLNSLEKFSLAYYECEGIQLDTPNLNSFALWSYFDRNDPHVEFRYPLKVKHLLCERFTSSELKNLEALVCSVITFDFRLADFESLKRLEIWPHKGELLQVEQIANERNRLKRNDLELIVSGFQEELVSCSRTPIDLRSRLVNGPIISFGLHLSDEYLEKIERNPSKFVGYVPWKALLALRNLPKLVEKMPKELFDHFLDIHSVHMNNPSAEFEESGISVSRFIEMFQKCKPRCLNIRNERCFAQREFYEQLTRLESLTELHIRIDSKANIHRENFDFFFNLQNLRKIHLNAPRLPLGFICKLIKQLKRLCSFRFWGLCGSRFQIVITLLKFPDLFYRSYFLSPSHVRRQCSDVDELVQEIKRMEQITSLHSLFYKTCKA